MLAMTAGVPYTTVALRCRCALMFASVHGQLQVTDKTVSPRV